MKILFATTFVLAYSFSNFVYSGVITTSDTGYVIQPSGGLYSHSHYSPVVTGGGWSAPSVVSYAGSYAHDPFDLSSLAGDGWTPGLPSGHGLGDYSPVYGAPVAGAVTAGEKAAPVLSPLLRQLFAFLRKQFANVTTFARRIWKRVRSTGARASARATKFLARYS